METRYTVRQTVEMTGVKSYVLRTGRKNWSFRFIEMNWVTVITPDMIFSFF